MPRRSGRSRLRFGELEELAPVGFLLRTGIHHDVGLRLEGQIRQRLRSGDRGSFENRYDGGPVGEATTVPKPRSMRGFVFLSPSTQALHKLRPNCFRTQLTREPGE